MPKFRYTGSHADTVFKGDKDMPKHIAVGPGDFIDLTKEDKELAGNKPLFDNDLLMEVKDK